MSDQMQDAQLNLRLREIASMASGKSLRRSTQATKTPKSGRWVSQTRKRLEYVSGNA